MRHKRCGHHHIHHHHNHHQSNHSLPAVWLQRSEGIHGGWFWCGWWWAARGNHRVVAVCNGGKRLFLVCLCVCVGKYLEVCGFVECKCVRRRVVRGGTICVHLVLARQSSISKPLDSVAVESRSVNNRRMCLKLSPVLQPTAAMRARTPLCSNVKLSHLVLYDNHAVIVPKWLLKRMCVCVLEGWGAQWGSADGCF